MSEGLEELAARCEAAEGADRLLEVLIGCAVRQMPITDPGAFLQAWPYPFVPAKFSGSIAAPDNRGQMVCHWEARPFTASLDAAMQLVPEGLGKFPREASPVSGSEHSTINTKAKPPPPLSPSVQRA